MSGEQAAEEVRQEYITAMGTELGGVFFELQNECLILHWKWQEYVALFGTKPERIRLLNEAAGAFYWVVQDTLWDDVLLRIARLTDSPIIFRKHTLTLKRLPELVQASFRSVVRRTPSGLPHEMQLCARLAKSTHRARRSSTDSEKDERNAPRSGEPQKRKPYTRSNRQVAECGPRTLHEIRVEI